MKRKTVGLILLVLALLVAGWLLFGRGALHRHTRVNQARAAAEAQGIDPRLLARANYSQASVQFEGPERLSDIVEFTNDVVSDLVYMVYLDPRDGTLWWLDELSGTGELCIRTTLYK